MTEYRYSLAAACLADLVPDADATCEAMGWGPGTFSVPLTTGKGITHRGTLMRATDEMVDAMAKVPGVSSAREAPADHDPQHWADFLKSNGLSLVEDPPE